MIPDPNFAREEFSAQIKDVYTELSDAMRPGNYDIESFNVLLLDRMQPMEKHDSDTHPEFYLYLHEMINESLQQATEQDCKISLAMRFMSRIVFSGFGPVFKSDPLANIGWLDDVEPVFDIYCQDELICPDEKLTFRVKITKDNQVRVIELASVGEIVEAARKLEATIQNATKRQTELGSFGASPVKKKPAKTATSNTPSPNFKKKVKK